MITVTGWSQLDVYTAIAALRQYFVVLADAPPL